MKTISFTYTKASGSVSDRVLLVQKTPDTMYEGIDISELSSEEQGRFIAKMKILQDKYTSAVEGIKNDFDLTHSYRRFDPSKMTSCVLETY